MLPNPTKEPVDAQAFLHSQLSHTHTGATLICTLGSSGATALRRVNSSTANPFSVHGWRPSADQTNTPQPLDSVGAGDTFIAGMLYALVEQRAWGDQERLEFANELAGRKVYRSGFEGLGKEMKECSRWGGVLTRPARQDKSMDREMMEMGSLGGS